MECYSAVKTKGDDEIFMQIERARNNHCESNNPGTKKANPSCFPLGMYVRFKAVDLCFTPNSHRS